MDWLRDGAETSGREENVADSEMAYIARSKRDVAEHFGVAWSTMQPRLAGKIGAKVRVSRLRCKGGFCVYSFQVSWTHRSQDCK